MTISLSNDSTSLCLSSASQGSKHVHQHCSQASPAIAGSPPHTHGGGPARTLQPQPARVLCLSLFPTLTTLLGPKVGRAAWVLHKKASGSPSGQFPVPPNSIAVPWHAIFLLSS